MLALWIEKGNEEELDGRLGEGEGDLFDGQNFDLGFQIQGFSDFVVIVAKDYGNHELGLRDQNQQGLSSLHKIGRG